MNNSTENTIKIRHYREQKGLSIEEFRALLSEEAKKEYSYNLVSKYERGAIKVTADLVCVIARVLEVSTDELLGMPVRQEGVTRLNLDITASTGVKRKDVSSLSKQELRDLTLQLYGLADKVIEENARMKDNIIKLLEQLNQKGTE